MINRVASVLLAGTVAVALVGTGVAIGASTTTSAKACVSKSSHRLALLSHGKCAHGYVKETLGAQGPRGKTGLTGHIGNTGPQGPGAIEQELTAPGDDEQHTFGTNVGGLAVSVNCNAAGNPTLKIAAADGTDLIDLSGTSSQNAALNVTYQTQVDNSFSVTGTDYAAFDVMARAGTAPLVELRVSAIRVGTICHAWEVAVPTATPTN